MIILDKNLTGQTIYVTASEGVTLTGNTTGYSMTLTNDMSKRIKSGITLTDVSLYPQRYNQFNFDNGIFVNMDCGTYVYDIYFNADTNTELVENGILKLKETEQEIDVYKYISNDNKQFFTYTNK